MHDHANARPGTPLNVLVIYLYPNCPRELHRPLESASVGNFLAACGQFSWTPTLPRSPVGETRLEAKIGVFRKPDRDGG